MYYNTETKRLHAGVFDESGNLVAAAREIGSYTFNYVPKSDPWTNFTAWLLPGGAKNYPVQMYPTMDTVNSVTELLKTKYPSLGWTHTGNPIDPKDIRDQVNIVAINKDGISESFSLGQLAVNIMNQGIAYAVDVSFNTELMQAFGWGA